MDQEKQNKSFVTKLSKFSWKKMDKSQWMILLLAGILLLVIALPTDKGSEEEDVEETKQEKAAASETTWDAYQDTIESQLEELLMQVEGVGKVQVMVTLEGTGEMVVEKDTPQVQSEAQEEDAQGGTRRTKENSWEESTVYIQQDGGSTPYVVKELVPEVEGVCVIAQGGDNAVVAKNISDAVQALFPIEVHKIKVMKMK